MKNLFDLTGKTAMVLGASSGLGASAAMAYAEYGAEVALLARRVEKIEKLAQEITEKTGKRAIAIACDATSEAAVKAAVEKTIETFGHIDILLNNAGIAVPGGVTELTEEAWEKSFNTNVKSMFLTSKYVVPHMQAQKYGKIVNIASVNAVLGTKGSDVRHAYNASKAAVKGLTLGMATSYMKDNITVNSIGPGLFPTEMTENTLFANEEYLRFYNAQCPAGRPAQKEELNGTVLYFSSDASSYVTNQFVIVDGGIHAV